MRCNSRRPAKSIIEAAEKEAIRQAEAQADDISNRAANEMVVAMYGCGISERTIRRIVNYYVEAVVPKWEDYRKDRLGDDAMKQYCIDNNLPYMVCEGHV